MSSSSSVVVVTADNSPTESRKSTRTPRASCKSASNSGMSSRGVKRTLDDCLAEQSNDPLVTDHVQANKATTVKKARTKKASRTTGQKTILQEKIDGLLRTVEPETSITPTRQRKLSVKKEPKPQRETKAKSVTKLKQPQPKKEPKAKPAPKPKKITKASLERAKFAEVSQDPCFQCLGLDTMKRIVRVYMDRLYLIHRHRHGETLKEEFDVYGSKGNVYKVTLAERPHCSCIDFAIHRKGKACKHLLFIYLKVLRLPSHMPVYSQVALSQQDLRQVFAESRQDPVAEATASPHLRKAWEVVVGYQADSAAASNSESVVVAKPQGKRMLPGEGDVCGVCYEDLEPGSEEGLEFCLKSCGRPIHKDCLSTWINSRSYAPPTCIWCRAVWHDAPQPKFPSARNAERTANGYGIGTSARGAVIDPNTGHVLNLAHVVAEAPALAPQ